MNEREIDELARAVVEHLGVPLGSESQALPDIGWRMPFEERGKREVGGGRRGGWGWSPPSSPLPPPPDITLAGLVDHTLLAADATRADIERLCDEALAHRFAAVCVNGGWVSLCAGRLLGSGVKVAAVVGFPLGATTSSAKAFEARNLVDEGADELDMVAPIGRLLDGDWDYVEADISGVVRSCGGRIVKVILETAVLTPIEIVKASALAKEAGASFVKTSTGFHAAGGATVEAVALMREAVGRGGTIGVKASGGIHSCASALQMLGAGASRLGTSSGVSLVECIGVDAHPFDDLVAHPARHAAACRFCD